MTYLSAAEKEGRGAEAGSAILPHAHLNLELLHLSCLYLQSYLAIMIPDTFPMILG